MKPLPRISPKHYKGLGDVVHAVAQPVAKALDRVAGTALVDCESCSQRRERLNAKFPFKTSSL